MPTIKYCESNNDIQATFNVMLQLRPKLKEDNYLELIHILQKSDGYRLIGYFDDNNICIAAAGFREKRSLFRSGDKELYIDDLITDSKARSQGIGKAMTDWLKAEAKKLDCVDITLDSGLQRVDAHKFYIREGWQETAKHFSRDRSPSPVQTP